MTNTHINVGGHKVTTNKVGSVHEITTLATGYSFVGGGYLRYCVVNGICTVTLWGIVRGAGAGSLLASGLPKPKMTYGNCGNTSGSAGSYLCYGVDTNIYCDYYGSPGDIYLTLNYLVADDWAES